MSVATMRYRIERVFDKCTRDHVASAPTINEAHEWIIARIKRAAITGLRLRPRDFDVVDTWEEERPYSLAACAEAVLNAPGGPNYRERYASLPWTEQHYSLPYACPIDGSAPACIYEGKTAREIVASLPSRLPPMIEPGCLGDYP